MNKLNNLSISDYDLSRLWELLKDDDVASHFSENGMFLKIDVELALNKEDDND